MAKYLVIVESPAKVKTIKNFWEKIMRLQHQTDMCAIFQRVSLGLMWNMILNRSTLLSEEKEISLQIFAKK